MHFHAELWVPETLNIDDFESFINEAMAPYNEDFHENGWWDWWQIGGRFSGLHEPEYNPEEDPRNIETCILCDGSGFRNDALGKEIRVNEPSYTCNGCGTFDHSAKKWRHGKKGPGKRVKWPTQWVIADCDVIPLTNAPNELQAYTLVANGEAFHKEKWNGKDWVDGGFDGDVLAKLKELYITNGYLVTLDYHS